MRLRPSCRSWLPLSTQQLRLRNLIRIEGINIKCDDAGAFIYYTLHQRNDGKPLYVSEYLPHRQLQKWAEIMCQNVFKSNEASVCVKIWARITTLAATKGVEQCNETLQEDHVRKSYDQDKLLFAWGISLSGLLPLSLKTNAKLVENTLLFHLNGECFTSAEHLLWDISLMFDELKNNQNSFELWQENGLHNEYNCVLESRGISSYSYKSDWKDICNDGVTSRYIRLYFKRSDTRKSYNLHQLLKLQKIQRIHLQRTRESRDFISNIQRRSINCITKNQLFISQIALSRHQAKFAMGRALSELFSEQAQANPYTLLHAQELKKQLETLRLNHRLLQSECDSYSSRIVQQRNRLTSISRIRQQRHSWLRSKNEKLQLEKKLFSKENQEILFLKQKRDEIIRDMERRKSALCVGLREIYPIEKNESGLNTINKVPFPSMDALVKDDRNAYASNIVANILPITLSVSLGYIAHLVQMIALIINRPLRLGS
ncbi:UV radiation resistance-associated gene protein-like [Rhagoletis pomonella]|uniref:UV radiation resistance-associated gene protein-like n=1 Tax=Rhagoletis pomonella TaxID=28610 RepID=UPI001784A7E1|nr:UV radiation resistance-associated gene protein-like [Rhagoletis pomonella]